MFYCLYFAMTGMHFLHMVIGLVILCLFLRPAVKERFTARQLRAGGDPRSLLALRRRHLDFPVSAALSDRPQSSMSQSTNSPSLPTYVIVYVALLVLLAATIVAAHFPLGAWNVPVALGIAFAKTMLVALFFMHVHYSGKLIWVVAGGALVWLAILLSVYHDYYTRGGPLTGCRPSRPSFDRTFGRFATGQIGCSPYDGLFIPSVTAIRQVNDRFHVSHKLIAAECLPRALYVTS